MKNPRVIIFSGYGLNCENDTKAAFEMAGADADIVHINDIIARPSLLKAADIVAFPGGFSYGDDTGSGKAYANRIRQHLGNEIEKFLARDTLMIGICNGFQIMTNAGILPGALIANDSARYICRWVDVSVKSTSPWLSGIDSMWLPIAHGEGKYVASDAQFAKMRKGGDIALTYYAGEITEHFSMAYNPNGSTDDIAGITGHNGRVLGLMPHPERAVRFTQLPHWTHLKEAYVREKIVPPFEGPGIQLFLNAVQYFS